MAFEGREQDLKRVLGQQLHAAVTASKVLVVGAGGIGCELLKNLVLSGFTDINVIDLDTIDVSNLNRQFLFRKKHVNMPKSVVAREAILEFNPAAKVVAFHDNVKKFEFGRVFVENFSLVFNALDNVSARKHVNRVCLATNTPLIESGSTGHTGQATVIVKGECECYECVPKEENRKFYPLCTIRNTPSKPVHCIEWAKELHKLLFGDREESRLYEPDLNVSTYMAAVVNRPATISDQAAREGYAKRVFDAIFGDEIKQKLQMRSYKCSPTPLAFAEIKPDSSASTAAGDDGELDIYKVPSLFDSAQAFVRSTAASVVERADVLGSDVWDKDIPVHLEFVTAAANLRASVFSIERNSQFKIKEIAGNIIPAIATTNAIVAGLQVLQAFNLLRHKLEPSTDAESTSTAPQPKEVLGDCRCVFVQPQPNGMGRLLNPIALRPPNPKCPICNDETQTLVLAIDTAVVTLAELVQNVLKGRLNLNEPCLIIGSSIVYDAGDVDSDDDDDDDDDDDGPDLLQKVLRDLPAGGICHGQDISVSDDSQDIQVQISIVHHDKWDEEAYPKRFFIGKQLPDGFHDQAPENGDASEAAEQQRDEEAPPRKLARQGSE